MQKSISSQAKTDEPKRVGTNGETRMRVDFLPLSPTHVREDASELTSFVDAYSSFLRRILTTNGFNNGFNKLLKFTK